VAFDQLNHDKRHERHSQQGELIREGENLRKLHRSSSRADLSIITIVAGELALGKSMAGTLYDIPVCKNCSPSQKSSHVWLILASNLATCA